MEERSIKDAEGDDFACYVLFKVMGWVHQMYESVKWFMNDNRVHGFWQSDEWLFILNMIYYIIYHIYKSTIWI